MKTWLKGGLIGIVIILIIFLIYYNLNIGNKSECYTNSDCSFFYTLYGNSSCVSCFYADKEWICMNKEKAKQEKNRIIKEYFNENPPLCERCLEDDYEIYSCMCLSNKCIKQKVEL